MVFKKISEIFLNRSNSYRFYKENYDNLEKTKAEYLREISRLKEDNKKQESEIDKLNELNNSLKNEIDSLKSSCEKIEEDNTYMKSLLKFEIESIEKYMFELVERSNNQKKE